MRGIILAGGSGSRLWPLSRELYPKQLLKLDGDISLLQSTFLRLSGLIEDKDIAVVTNVKHLNDVKLQLNKLSKESVVISEPLSKNTMPAIACTLKYFQNSMNSSEDDTVIILPSDHLIKDLSLFQKSITYAEELANEGYLVTFGIKPTYPETGYGYIKVKESLMNGFIVDKFVEKPDLPTAEQYLEEGCYFWNGGMFIGKISVFLSEIEKYIPDLYNQLPNLSFDVSNKIDYDFYDKLPSISIDYAIMEKSDKVALVQLLSDWNDLGSWKSLYDIKSKDENDNVIAGNVITHNVKNSLIYSSKELIAVSGLENIVLVETEDAIMACRIDRSQDVKKLFDMLKKSENEVTLLHKTIYRPWGYYTCINKGDDYLTKTICVFPNQKLSLQSHNHRSEHWIVIEGVAHVILEGKEYDVASGNSIDIPLKAKHSLQNLTNDVLKIIEVQKGDFISEDDIVRYKDIYGRI